VKVGCGCRYDSVNGRGPAAGRAGIAGRTGSILRRRRARLRRSRPPGAGARMRIRSGSVVPDGPPLRSQEQLIADLDGKVIAPAEAKAEELGERRRKFEAELAKPQ
jgi:hypothetical protein